MEHLIQAVERRRALDVPAEKACAQTDAPLPILPAQNLSRGLYAETRQIELDRAYLESKRIIAHDVGDPRSRSFDILRTQILHTMEKRAWQFLAVTSPTPGCGKTLTALNLAMSIARQPDKSVLLVDLDLQKPSVASTLGLRSDQGLLSVLAGKTSLSSAMLEVCINKYRLTVLPTETPTQNSSEWLSCRPMTLMLQDIKKNYRSSIVIFDLPPILPSDDVISILPHMDGVLFVAAIGTSTLSEIKQCNKHLETSQVIRIVVNKAPETTSKYYY